MAKEGSSDNYEHTSKFTLVSQKVFLYILYERSNNFGVIIKRSILILVGGCIHLSDPHFGMAPAAKVSLLTLVY